MSFLKTVYAKKVVNMIYILSKLPENESPKRLDF